YDHTVGWSIGNGEEYPEHEAEHQDYVESQALYNVLERDIIPLFYTRGRDSVPREWIEKVKNSMRVLSPFFNTHRMVQEYTDHYYMPVYNIQQTMLADDMQAGLEFAAWRKRVEKAWKQIEIKSVNISDQQVKVGKAFEVEAAVNLGDLKPEDVQVQLYYGQ